MFAQRTPYDQLDQERVQLKANADSMSGNERLMAEAIIDDKQNKLKRRLLSTIRFIGELFKENLLKPTIMYECIDNLIAVTDEDGSFKSFKTTQDEQYIELLCRLLHTIGAKLEMQETSSTATPLTFYFSELERLSKDKKLNSRIRFSLEEVIELRRNNWQSRREEEGPAKLDQIHEKAAAEELAKKQWSESGGNQQYNQQHSRFSNTQSQDNNRSSGGQQDARGLRNQGGQGQGQGQGGDRNNFNQQRGDSQGSNYQGDARDQRGLENRSGKGQGSGQAQQHSNGQDQNRGSQQQRSQQQQQQQQQQRSFNGNGGNSSPSPSSSSQSQQTTSKSAELNDDQITERVNSAVGEYCNNKNPIETLQTLSELPQTAAGFVILNVRIHVIFSSENFRDFI